MPSRFTELVVDCHDPEMLAAFWCAVLGYEVLDEDDGIVEIGPGEAPSNEDSDEWAARHRAGPSAPSIVFVVVPESKALKNRLHIDVSPVGDHNAEVDRLRALGATEADIGQGDVSWTVMRDPEGNEFCVLRSLAD